MPSLMECSGDEGMAAVKHGNFVKGDFWLLCNGFIVTIAEQYVGEEPTQAIRLPKETFDYFVKKYTEQQ